MTEFILLTHQNSRPRRAWISSSSKTAFSMSGTEELLPRWPKMATGFQLRKVGPRIFGRPALILAGSIKGQEAAISKPVAAGSNGCGRTGYWTSESSRLRGAYNRAFRACASNCVQGNGGPFGRFRASSFSRSAGTKARQRRKIRRNLRVFSTDFRLIFAVNARNESVETGLSARTGYAVLVSSAYRTTKSVAIEWTRKSTGMGHEVPNG